MLPTLLDDFKKARPVVLDAARVFAASTDNIREWFERIEDEVAPSTYHPALLFNMDETMIQREANRAKVFTLKENPAISIETGGNNSIHVTLVLCVSAAGAHSLPCAICPRKTLPSDLLPFLDFLDFAGQAKGWITRSIFESWLKERFIPFVESQRIEKHLVGKPAILFVDAHSSRESTIAVELLKQHDITMVCIPSHTSHVLQPLDCGVNRKYKEKYKAKKSSITNYTSRHDTLTEMLTVSIDCLHDAFNPMTIMQAWKRSGLYPFDPTQPLSSPHVTETSKLPPRSPRNPNKRKRISIEGQCITKKLLISVTEQRQEPGQVKKVKSGGRPKKRQKTGLDTECAIDEDMNVNK